MDQSIVRIADLSNYSKSQLENVTIKASVSIRSLRHGNNRHGYFYMDLRDESGDIPAVAYINSRPCDNQLHLIQDNRTYMITNISLTTSNKRYTSIQNEKEIVLNEETVIKLCGHTPKVEWPLTPLSEVDEEDETKLFNFVGICTRVTDTDVVQGEFTREMTLVDEKLNEVYLNIWNSETSLFDELDLNFHPVFFVKDARSYKYRGIPGLTTSRYLQLLHPDDPRAAKIRKGMQENSSKNGTEMPGDKTPNQLAGYPYCTPANFTRETQNENQSYVKIADLASITDTDNVILIATVTVKSYRLMNEKNKIRFYMDLYDHSGEIVAVAYDDACVKFQNIIEKNKTYSFTGFSLRRPNRQATSVSHRRLLCLESDAEVKLCGIAPKLEGPISYLTMIQPKDNKDKRSFFQAIGLYTGFEKGLVTLVDQLGRELLLEVRNENTAMFDALDPKSRPVFFVKDARISNIKHKGNKILTTRWYLELLEQDDPRACSITESLVDAASTGAGDAASTGVGDAASNGAGETVPIGVGDAADAASTGTGDAASTSTGDLASTGAGDAALNGAVQTAPIGVGDAASTGAGDAASTDAGESASTGAGESAPTGAGDAASTGAGDAASTSAGETAPAGAVDVSSTGGSDAKPHVSECDDIKLLSSYVVC